MYVLSSKLGVLHLIPTIQKGEGKKVALSLRLTWATY